MQVKRNQISDTKIKLVVTADQTSLDNVKKAVLQHLSTRHAKIPGFRAGKAPLAMVEKHTDPNLLQSEFLEEAINRLYLQVIKSENIRPIAQPQVSIKKFVPFTTLEFEAEVEAVGNITLPNYKNIKKPRPEVKITAKDIDEVIQNLRNRSGERKEVNRAAKAGDELTIDFKGVDDKGKPVNGADGTDYPLILGSNSFIPGFEDELIGLKAAEDKTFTITFPKDYNVAALQSKKVTFSVSVKKVQSVTEPKLDDVFAATVGPFKTLAELKADIKKQLLAERQQQANRDYENSLVQEIASKTRVAVPDVLIDDQVRRAEEQERQNLAYRGQTWQEHLAEEGVTEEQHRQRNRPQAEEAVKAGLALSEIADQENLIVTPEELEIRIQLLKGQYKDQAMQTELDKPENRQDIENRLLTEKTVAKLVEYATK